MKIIILGAGTVGSQIAKQLISENKDVVLVEKDPEKVRSASESLDCLIVEGQGNNLEVLRRAGIEDADFFISLTDSDEVNMIACGLVSSEFPRSSNIARVRNIDYYSDRIMKNPFLGIDFIVNPEIEAAKNIVRNIEYGVVSDIMFFEQSNIQIRNFFVNSGSIFEGKAVKDIRKPIKGEYIIAGIERDEEFIIPSGETTILLGDKLYIVATETEFEKLFFHTGKHKTDIKDIIIVGGGKIGGYVMESLNSYKKRRLNVKVIEKNYERCWKLAEKYPNFTIISGDISDENIFEEENLENYDLIILSTTNQELNILTALYAKSQGIEKSIVLINNSNYTNMAVKLGIDSIVNPKNSMINPILKFIRKGNLKTIHSILDGAVEVLEFTVNGNNKWVNRKIRSIKMPPNSLILNITRGKRNFIPDGNFLIQDNDNIIIISEKNHIEEIQEMFMG